MFTVEPASQTAFDEVVFAFHPPSQTYHARLVPRSIFREATLMTDYDLDDLISRVQRRVGEITIAPALIEATKRWRPRAPRAAA